MSRLKFYILSGTACFLALGFCVFESESVSVWKDVTLTRDEKHALDKFKLLMNNSLPHDYMMKDIYLIKWLRARNLDLRSAERMLMQHLAWREEYKMDTIVDEDFGNMVNQYTYTTDGTDYEGRPVLAINAAEWDIRRAVLSGRKTELKRWSFRAFEVGASKIRQMQAEGQNVTQFILLSNFAGFNAIQNACLQCIDVILDFIVAYEQNYPGMADSIIAIKTPSGFEVLLRAVFNLLSKETRQAVQIYGTNKNQWQKNILKKIPSDQLDEEFGGTRNNWVFK